MSRYLLCMVMMFTVNLFSCVSTCFGNSRSWYWNEPKVANFHKLIGSDIGGTVTHPKVYFTPKGRLVLSYIDNHYQGDHQQTDIHYNWMISSDGGSTWSRTDGPADG